MCNCAEVLRLVSFEAIGLRFVQCVDWTKICMMFECDKPKLSGSYTVAYKLYYMCYSQPIKGVIGKILTPSLCES